MRTEDTLSSLPIWQLTTGQFIHLLEEHIKEMLQQQEPAPLQEKEWLRFDEVAEVLGIKKTSVYRYTEEWEKLGAINKVGATTFVNIKLLRKNKQYTNNRTKREF